jgi:hypothetical protein
VLVAGNADLVICGHWHHSMSDDRDDIQYRMLGPSGAAPNREHHAESGNLAQFGWLVVDENGAHFSIIKGGGVLPSDAFPYEMNQLEWRIENRAVAPVDFEVDPTHPTSSGNLGVSFTNVTDEKLVTALSFAETNWRMSPREKTIPLETGSFREMRFSFVRQNGRPLFPGPEITATFPFFGTTYVLTKTLAPTLHVRLKKASSPPVVDGDLGDAAWKTASPLGPFMEFRGDDLTLGTDGRAAIANETLYLAFRMSYADEKDEKWKDGALSENTDHLKVSVDDDLTAERRRRIVVTSQGWVSNKRDQIEGEAEDARVFAAAAKNVDGWTAEIAVPLDHLPLTKGTKTIGFNFARCRVRGDKSSCAYWQPLLEHDEESMGKLSW